MSRLGKLRVLVLGLPKHDWGRIALNLQVEVTTAA